ncbi:3755_t:CDS:10 [Funneliformis geosporum]|uniref:mitogen-activated protein kinase kinase kinase n=1 Tax=Funneliformis geosporum TaxID=1117311 RepID=A0A9W4SY83_9GLOM|nr:978_t:CDS:10 [Funneliformis geosporum]CAI2187382.1 3755_t:CDS:10 [Funneliformis geosporum]
MDSTPQSPTVNCRFTFDNVRNWKYDQVACWLQENNFREYQKVFSDNDINGDVLLELDHEILKELRIRSIGERVRILLAVKTLLKCCVGNTAPYVHSIKYYVPKQHEASNSLESVKQRVIKVIGEDGATRTIYINNVTDAKSILARVLQKFNINDDVEKYSLFTTLSDSGSARSLSDEELVKICRSSDRPERDRLILRKKHVHMNFDQLKRQMRDKKLENFFGEKPPTSSQVGMSQKKLRNFFGQRPPSELISLNLTEYFPGHNSEELERSCRNSVRRASRLSSVSKFSRRKSKRMSYLYDDDKADTFLSPMDYSETAIRVMPLNSFNLFNIGGDFQVFKWMQGALIGMGSFSSVYLGLNAITGELMAVKQVELPTGQSANEERKKSMLDALQREITLLKDLHHENIVQYLGGSVATMLNNYGPLEETLVRSFNRQILQGLNYLHEKDIIHRDIKGANILVDNKGGIKISDFGISKKVEDQIMANTSVSRPSLQGSVFWMAPEVVKQTPYTSKADIWSLGCLIVEMFTGDHPFPEFNQMQAMFKIGSQSCSPEIPEGVSNETREFLKKTFELNHNNRPTAKALLSHPFALSTSFKSNT